MGDYITYSPEGCKIVVARKGNGKFEVRRGEYNPQSLPQCPKEYIWGAPQEYSAEEVVNEFRGDTPEFVAGDEFRQVFYQDEWRDDDGVDCGNTVYGNAEDAVRAAWGDWEHLTSREKKRARILVLEYRINLRKVREEIASAREEEEEIDEDEAIRRILDTSWNAVAWDSDEYEAEMRRLEEKEEEEEEA